MKKILLFLIVFSGIFSNAQLTEVYDFGYNTGPSSYDFQGNFRERIFDGKFFYYVKLNNQTYLYSKDTNTSTPVQIKNISVNTTSPNPNTTILKYKANEKYLYFTTFEMSSGNNGVNELWRTDGTETGTVKISTYTGNVVNFFNISSLEYSVKGNVRAKNSLNGDFIFTSSPTPTTRAVWITDGTPAGTIKLMENTVASSYTSAYSPIEKVGNKMLFSVYNSTGWEMWSTDGSIAGTQFLAPLFATVGLINDNFYYYSLLDDVGGTIRYTANGTSTQSRPLSIPMSGIDGFINDNKELYTSNAIGTQLYHTTDFSDMKKIADLPQTNIYYVEASDAGVLFSKLLNINMSGEYTFYVAGRNTGATIINPGNPLKSSRETFAFKNTFYLSNALKNDVQYFGQELWRMDDQHAEMLKDIYPGTLTYAGNVFPMQSNPQAFFAHNGEMFFIADNANGQKLFKFNPDFTFTNAALDNNWSNKNNWLTNATPMSTDNATIPLSKNPVVNGLAYAKNLEVSSPIAINSGSLNISGILNLNSKVILNNANLALKGSTSKITGGNLNNYIITEGNSAVIVHNLNTERGNINIPLGSAANYNPLILANTGISDSFSAKFSDGISNTSNGAVNGTWDITEGTAGGSAVNATFCWNQSQENTTFNRNLAKVGHFKNAIWTEENSSSVSGNNPYQISATGITSFSPFGILNFGTLGTFNTSLKNTSVYPNPFTDILNITVNENSTLSLYDASGKLVHIQTLKKGYNVLEKSTLLKGIYIYKVTGSTGKEMMSGKVMKL